LWPGPGLVTQHVLSFASQTLSTRVGFHNYVEALKPPPQFSSDRVTGPSRPMPSGAPIRPASLLARLLLAPTQRALL
ncbi:MAG: hypothetical protein WAV47_00010, partial [Blastocatellia bacterium]